MSGKVWTRHYQIEWENRAANPDTPLWARVVSLAYGRHAANGHANFQRGQLAWILGTPPKDGQPFQRRSRDSLNSAIKVAVRYGWLADGSCTECLVVPQHAISGPHGDEAKLCPVHLRKDARKRGGKPQLRVVS